jgi:hypothetical protein
MQRIVVLALASDALHGFFGGPGIAYPEVEMGGRGGLRCAGTLFPLQVGPPRQMLP